MKKKIVYIGNKLAVHGHNPTTIDTLSRLFIQEGYPIIAASSKRNKVFRILDMMQTVIKHSRTADFVLIDTYSTANFWYSLVISQLCRVLKIRYIPFLHGGDLPKRLKRNPQLCRMIFENSYKNVVPSAYLMDQLQKNNIPNLVQIPNFLELDQYSFKERKTIKPRLLWVRAFAAIYNPKMAVDVAESLKNRYPDVELCMIGPDKDGSWDEVKKYAALKKVDVRFTGKLTKEEWTALASDYDVFISTSHFDNMPVSVMEAMALGLAVVTTNVGGIPFLLKNDVDARLVADNDVAGMVNAVKTIIESPEKTQKQIIAAHLKVQKMDWKEIKKQWGVLFED